MGRKWAISMLLVAILAVEVGAQRRVGVAFYDVDRLYDTIPSLFYSDDKYTPEGRLKWTSDRYWRKIENTVAVIDSMALPIVALWGVESEGVVRDLVAKSAGEYSFLHETQNSLTGMDFALLYYGDMLFVERREVGRNYMVVECEILGESVAIVLSAEERVTEEVVEDYRDREPTLKLIVLGRASDKLTERYALQSPLDNAKRSGRGTINSAGVWRMRDLALIDTAFSVRRADVFARRFMLNDKTGRAHPTYSGSRYVGGYSYSLPIFLYLDF